MTDISSEESAGADRIKGAASTASASGAVGTSGGDAAREPFSTTRKAGASGGHSAPPTTVAGKSTPIGASIEDLGEQIGRGVLNTGRGASRAVRSAGSRARKVAEMAGGASEASAPLSTPSPDARVLHFGPTTDTWTPAVARAEGLVDDLVERAKPLAMVVGLRLRRIFARAREEAEDIWAEAESLRALGRVVDNAAARAKKTEGSAAPSLTLGQSHTPPTDPA